MWVPAPSTAWRCPPVPDRPAAPPAPCPAPAPKSGFRAPRHLALPHVNAAVRETIMEKAGPFSVERLKMGPPFVNVSCVQTRTQRRAGPLPASPAPSLGPLPQHTHAHSSEGATRQRTVPRSSQRSPQSQCRSPHPPSSSRRRRRCNTRRWRRRRLSLWAGTHERTSVCMCGRRAQT